MTVDLLSKPFERLNKHEKWVAGQILDLSQNFPILGHAIFEKLIEGAAHNNEDARPISARELVVKYEVRFYKKIADTYRRCFPDVPFDQSKKHCFPKRMFVNSAISHCKEKAYDLEADLSGIALFSRAGCVRALRRLQETERAQNLVRFFGSVEDEGDNEDSLFELPKRVRGGSFADHAANVRDWIPSKLMEIDAVKEISLSLSEITSIPPEIQYFTNLESLSIAYEPLDSLPDEMRNLKKLKFLQIQFCRLVKVPEIIKELEALETLDLQYNPLTSIPEWVCELPNLKRLSFSRDKIQQPLPVGVKEFLSNYHQG